MTQHEYMTVQEAADLAHVDPQTIRRWFRQQRLTRYHVGPRRVLVKRTQIEAMIQPETAVPSSDDQGV